MFPDLQVLDFHTREGEEVFSDEDEEDYGDEEGEEEELDENGEPAYLSNMTEEQK